MLPMNVTKKTTARAGFTDPPSLVPDIVCLCQNQSDHLVQSGDCDRLGQMLLKP
jgi:hypothetical protein